MSKITEGNWKFNRILGEGAFGEVHLLVNIKTMDAIAAKIINLKKYKENLSAIMKEIQIHKGLIHENIIRCYGHTEENDIEYIFLEYASGGELFDRIEPDIGLVNVEAFKYFTQIINGVEYLHSLGIAHRDLKPENLLLTNQDVIKISDFGTATVFMIKGNTYLSNTICGTLPYMAPEVFAQKPYSPDKVDIWSCGIILVALLAGELPWDQPSIDCKGFKDWKEQKFIGSLWSKIDNLCLSLISKILVKNVKHRYTIKEIKNNKCYNKFCNKLINKNQGVSPIAFKKRKITSSQPVKVLNENQYSDNNFTISKPLKSFSQPSHLENLLINTQFSQFSQVSQNNHLNYVNMYQRLVKRMTRFFTKLSYNESCKQLAKVLEKLDYTFFKSAFNIFTISTIDKRKVPLVFKASIFEMKPCQVLIDFRLSRGDGIEFKRHFVDIRNCLKNIILTTPINWTICEATNSVP